jgi:hypothetical protein
MADELLGPEHTLPVTVANIGFLVDRYGKDCSPLQYLRELTQNAIEAIQATPSKQGTIVWDVDWATYDLTGTFKLCIIDTGTGMAGNEMVTYINQLSSSGRDQAHDKNFGVGAKIAGATRNHEGLVYLSWKDAVGYTVHLWRDPDTGAYGLRQFELPDGSFNHWGRLDDSVKPDAINGHGTKVVLLGNEPDQNTMQAPETTASPSRWIARYLNTRYYEFPEGVIVRAREGWEHPRDDRDRNLLRTITGQKAYLDEHAERSGIVELDGARAHWWILRDEGALTQNSGLIASSGHAAALFQNELYEMQVARAGTARLQQFGVIFGTQRVVLYIEPVTGDGIAIESNTARTHLLRNSEPLPWADWASEFRSDDKMPEDIKVLMDQVASGSATADHRQSIRERLKQIADLFKLSRYRPTPKGNIIIDDESLTTGGQSATGGTSRTNTGKGGRGGAGGIAGSVYGLFLAANDGTPGEAVRGIEPRVEWVSIANGKRTQGDIEDRAAKYLPETNMLFINADFRVYLDMVDRWVQQYAHTPGVQTIVEDSVQEWFEQLLVEAVMGVHSLKGSPEWDLQTIAQAWSPEALTAAVMPRYHTEMAVRRALGSKLGTLKVG